MVEQAWKHQRQDITGMNRLLRCVGKGVKDEPDAHTPAPTGPPSAAQQQQQHPMAQAMAKHEDMMQSLSLKRQEVIAQQQQQQQQAYSAFEIPVTPVKHDNNLTAAPPQRRTWATADMTIANSPAPTKAVQPPNNNDLNAASDLPSGQQTASGVGFVIGTDTNQLNIDDSFSMTKKKEMIMINSLKRRQDQERKRILQQEALARKRDEQR